MAKQAQTTSQEIGVVSSLSGKVTAIGADGVERILSVGDKVYADDMIKTSDSSAVSLRFNDGTTLDLNANAQALLDSDVYSPAATDTAETATTPDAAQQAIAEGADPGAVLPAPAAGAANAGGDSDFVVEALTGQRVTPESGFETEGLSFTFREPEGVVYPGEPGLPTLSINDVTVYESDAGYDGGEGQGAQAFFTVTLSEVSDQDVTFDYSVVDQSATNGYVDYYMASGSGIIPAGSTSVDIYFDYFDDTIIEGNETFAVNLSNPVNAGIADGQGIGTIIDSGEIHFEIDGQPVVNEGDTANYEIFYYIDNGASSLADGQTASVVVSLNDIHTTPADYASFLDAVEAGANAATGVTFDRATSTLTFTGGPGNSTSVNVNLLAIADGQIEPPPAGESGEQYNITLSNPTSSTGVVPTVSGPVTTTIIDNDLSFSLSGPVSIVEGDDPGTVFAQYTITRTGALEAGQEVVILVTTANGTATSPADYYGEWTLDMTFTSADLTKTFSVPITSDTVVEPTEDYSVNISVFSYTTSVAPVIGTGTVTTNIIDDDVPTPAITIGPQSNEMVVQEDSTTADNTVAVNASTNANTTLTTIVITGVDLGWTVDLAGLVTGGGTATRDGTTITINGLSSTSYNGSFGIAPPADSDIDLGDLEATVTAVSIYDAANSATANDSVTVYTDANADGIADGLTVGITVVDSNDVPNTSFQVGETGSATVTATFGDFTDGSETHTVVVDIPTGFLVSNIVDGGVFDDVLDTITWVVSGGSLNTSFDVSNTNSVNGTATFTATATANENTPAPVDNEDDASAADNIATATDDATVTIAPTPNPNVTLGIDTEQLVVKEDSNANVVVSASTNIGSSLDTITISGLDPDWTYDLTGLDTDGPGLITATLNLAGTEITISGLSVSPYTGSFNVAPPQDTDIDLGTLTATVTAVNIVDPAVTGSDTDTMDVVVDAVLDEQADVAQTAPVTGTQSGSPQTFGLNLNFSLVSAAFAGSLAGGPDGDGSESVTSVAININAGTLLLGAGTPAEIILTPLGGGDYTLTGYTSTVNLETAIESLQVEVPAGFAGTVNGTINTVTEEANTPAVTPGSDVPASGVETDTTDNTRDGAFDFALTVNSSEIPPAIDPGPASMSFYQHIHVQEFDPSTPAYEEPPGGTEGQPDGIGVLPENLTFDASSDVRVTFVGEDAGFQSTLGWYVIAPDGTIQNPDLVWENTSLGVINAGDSRVVNAGTGRIGFFFLANGYTLNTAIMDDLAAGIGSLRFGDGTATINDTAPTLFYVAPGGAETALDGFIFHTAAYDDGITSTLALNPDGSQHVNSGLVPNGAGGDGLQMAFEDLADVPGEVYPADWDYNDTIFRIDLEPTLNIHMETRPIAPALDITDADGTQMSAAAVTFTSGVTDDLMTLGGSYTIAGDGVSVLDGLVDTGIDLAITGTGGVGTVFSFTGTADITAYEALLQNIMLGNPGHDVPTTPRTFSFVTTDTDGLSSTVEVSTIVDITMLGQEGSTLLEGGDGNDILYGDAGDDTLTGGAGSDTFVWQSGDEGTVVTPAIDTVTDFAMGAGGDVLDLDDILTGIAITGATTGADLTAYLSINGTDTINVAPNGTDVTQQIVLSGVDLTVGGSLGTDAAMLQNLLDNSQIV